MNAEPDSNDSNTPVAELRNSMAQFVAERDWTKFHSPKNLAMSISIEAAELMEHFQWLTCEQSQQPEPAQLEQIRQELADVLCYCFGLANQLDIDITRAVADKMELNRSKYPIEEIRGRFGHNDSINQPADLGKP